MKRFDYSFEYGFDKLYGYTKLPYWIYWVDSFASEMLALAICRVRGHRFECDEVDAENGHEVICCRTCGLTHSIWW